MSQDRPTPSFVHPSIQSGFDDRLLRLLAQAEAFQAWYAPRVAARSALAANDHDAIMDWVNTTLDDGVARFGLGFTCGQVIITAVGTPDGSGTYPGMSAELNRLLVAYEAVAAIQMHHAQVDAIHDALYEPLDAVLDDSGAELLSHAFLAMRDDPTLSADIAMSDALADAWDRHLDRTLPE